MMPARSQESNTGVSAVGRRRLGPGHGFSSAQWCGPAATTTTPSILSSSTVLAGRPRPLLRGAPMTDELRAALDPVAEALEPRARRARAEASRSLMAVDVAGDPRRV